MKSQSIDPAPRRMGKRSVVAIAMIGILALLIFFALSLDPGEQARFLTGGGSVLVLALPAFIAGVLSFLSPCTLPILPAYFAFTFQAGGQGKARIAMMGIAFFLGLATTMTLLGASATALSGLLFANRSALTFWGGLIIIGFGIMGMLGKGFAGPQLQERPAATFAGSYIYGATFALGWTACVGPILGALLTLLAATSDVAIIQGAVLAFIYSLGLGLPLILIATFFHRLGTGSRVWRLLRGRGFTVRLFGRELFLHSTSLASGALMVVMGLLLATGRLEWISQYANTTPMAQWWVEIEAAIGRLFGL
ncbi:MAG: cytochrome c biogenesis CcdA family protein [Chloroflexus sp.]|uniref:cytochrome c biogenesis CcdA family protein n=1 Tax=Chloroflexus sp. TaxID=1904827 RepID=UPI004049F131